MKKKRKQIMLILARLLKYNKFWMNGWVKRTWKSQTQEKKNNNNNNNKIFKMIW